MEKEMQIIDKLQFQLKQLKKSLLKREFLNDKFLNNQGMSEKQIEKMNAELTWLCMNIDKEKTDIARTYKGSEIEVGTEEKEYNPTGFHSYKH